MRFYSDKTIFIFGGSCGIGLATATKLAKLGARIHLFARREEILKKAAEGINQHASVAHDVVYSSADVTDEENLIKVLESAVQHSGIPDIVLNCAGAAKPNYFEQISAQQFENTFKLNVGGARNIAAAALPLLKKSKGHLINTSSIAGFIGVFGYTDYSASKFALVGFSEALQQEVKQHGISVSLLYPPDTLTEGFEEEEKTKPIETRAISAGNKLLSAEQVADAVVAALPKRSFHIIPGLDSRLSHVAKRWVPGIVNWVMMRAIKKAQSA